MRKKKQESEEDSDLRISGVDFGNIELPDLDLSLFDVLNDEYNEETRYNKAEGLRSEAGICLIRQRGKVG